MRTAKKAINTFRLIKSLHPGLITRFGASNNRHMLVQEGKLYMHKKLQRFINNYDFWGDALTSLVDVLFNRGEPEETIYLKSWAGRRAYLARHLASLSQKILSTGAGPYSFLSGI